MPVEFPATTDCGLDQRGLHFRWWGFLAGLLTLLVVESNLRVWQLQPDWLATNRPCAIAIPAGQGTADVYLTPDTPVMLLVSNLGSSNHSSVMTIKSERLHRAPRFRPLPLASPPSDLA